MAVTSVDLLLDLFTELNLQVHGTRATTREFAVATRNRGVAGSFRPEAIPGLDGRGRGRFNECGCVGLTFDWVFVVI